MAGSSDTYKVGLHNVGSYQVSGRPWLKSNSIADEEVQVHAFPNVTKEIHVCNDHAAAGHTLNVAFPEPRRAVNMPDGADEDFSTTFADLNALSFGIWFKFDAAIPTAIRLVDLRDATGNATRSLRVQNRNAKLRLFINNAQVDETSGNVLLTNTWYHLVVTTNRSTPLTKVYLDGVEILSDATAPTADFAQIYLGSLSANFDGFYSDGVLFDTDLSAPQVADLYGGIGSENPKDHSEASNLVSWWAFEDNFYKNYFSTDDTGTLILDRVGSSNLVIDTGTATFGNGRFIGTAFATGQAFQLIGAQQVDISAKCIFMAVQSVGGTLEYSIFSSLTGIPAERMKGIGTYE